MPKDYKYTTEQKERMSKSHMGQRAWNKGTGGCKRGHDPVLYVAMPKTGVYVCLGCKRENGAKYRTKNRGNPSYIIRNRVGRYKIPANEFDRMLEAQNGNCAICGTGLILKNCRIDHCHESGKVRGLLCTSCNTAIGLLKDSIESLENAIKYLESNAIGMHCKASKAA